MNPNRPSSNDPVARVSSSAGHAESPFSSPRDTQVLSDPLSTHHSSLSGHFDDAREDTPMSRGATPTAGTVLGRGEGGGAPVAASEASSASPPRLNTDVASSSPALGSVAGLRSSGVSSAAASTTPIMASGPVSKPQLSPATSGNDGSSDDLKSTITNTADDAPWLPKDSASGGTFSAGSSVTNVQYRAKSAGPRKPWTRPASTPYGLAGLPGASSASSYTSHSATLYPRNTTAAGSAVSAVLMAAKGTYDNEHDPGRWHVDVKEADDYLHDPEKPNPPTASKLALSGRAVTNIGTLAILVGAVLMLFLGYPLISHFSSKRVGTKGGFNLGGTNGTSQLPDLGSVGIRTDLIDPDTPEAARTRTGWKGQKMNLVFSDEFNQDGRSFYPGDDPYWEAVDLWAGGTGDYEWYSPSAVTTEGGFLVITAEAYPNHNLNFISGELTSWNKFCFQGGYLEVSVVLPGSPTIAGWWPAVWTMGNLGRANYGATTQGTWPYAYDACDAGALLNQTNADGLTPEAALTSGALTSFNDKYKSQSLSFLPGQKLSRCTCPGEDHPGPKHADGSFVGRSAPEIDVFEAQVDTSKGGTVSQSGQWAPFNYGYYLINTTGTEYEGQAPSWALSTYRGNVNQQSASSIIETNQRAYEATGNLPSVYGFEYKPGYVQDDAYIHWVTDGKPAWTINAAALAADPRVQIAARPIPQEPMYIIMNLAISSGFGYIDWDNIQFPAKMKIDYVRVYQDEGSEKIGCDPEDFPTAEYINRHMEAYTNPNLTIWGGTPQEGGYQQNWPRNRLYPGGCNAPPKNTFGP